MAAPNPDTEILAATAAPNHDSVRRYKLAVATANAAAVASAAQAAFVDNLGTEIVDATAAPNPDSLSRFKLAAAAASTAPAASAAAAAAAAQAAFVDNPGTEIVAAPAAPNPATEIRAAVGLNSERRKLSATERSSRLFAAFAAVGPNPHAELVARGTEILANAFVAPKTYTEFAAARTAVAHPEYRRQLAAAVAFIADNPDPEILDDSLGGLKLADVTAITAKAAAATAKVEGYYLEFAKKLFEPLEDAKRFFVVEKDAITERLQKEKDAITERLQKEKDEVTERLHKAKDEVAKRLHKGKDEIIESKKRTRVE